MTETTYENFFAALSGNRRLEMLRYLKANGPKSVTEISEGTGIEQSAVSHGLNKLLACECVHIEARGKQRMYSLNHETIEPLFDLIDKHIEKFCKNECQCCTLPGGRDVK